MQRSSSPFDTSGHDALRAFRRRIPAPVGCLLVVVLLPLVLIGGLIFLLLSLLRGPRSIVRSGASGNAPAAPRSPAEAAREIALCSLVRTLAMDARFTREEALATAVIAPPGAAAPSTEDLLRIAQERGWVTGTDDALSVTPTGRTAAEAFLDRAGV